MTQISRINRVTDMKQIFRIFTLITVAVLTAGQAWAGSYNGVVNTNVTGGELTLSYQEGTDDPVAVTAGVTDVPAGAIVTIVAGPNLGYTLKDFDITAQSTTGSGNAEARSFTRSNGPGIGQTVNVTVVSGQLGVYTFAMPDGDNVLVTATFKEKPYLGDGTNAHISYYSYDAQGNRITSNTGDDGHPRVYILDGSETELGQSGETVWYVSTTQTYNRSLTVLGTVGLILRDGTTMTVSHSSNATASISGDADASLTTYGQSAGTGRLAVSNADGTAISVGAFSILGTGVAISNSTQGISTAANGTLHIAVLPTFGSGTAKNGCDIFLSVGTVIDIAADITAAPQQPVTVGFGEGYTAPFSFTNGYGAHCHYATGSKAGEVIAVGEMFTSSTQLEEYQAIVYGDGREYSSSDTYVPGEASLINDTESTTPSVVATVTNAKGTMEYFFGTDHYDSHFRGAVLAANAATSDVELKLCWPIDFGNNDGVTFDNTHQVTVGAVTRPVAITLNLDIFTLSGAGTYIIWVNEDTSLTITNTGDPSGVPIPGGYSSTTAIIRACGKGEAINNQGTLSITGGQILCNSSDVLSGIFNNGMVYFKGGTIYGFHDGIQNEYDGTLYFSGGVISSCDIGINNTRASNYSGTTKAYVSGGGIFCSFVAIQNSGELTISGGILDSNGNYIITNDGTMTLETLRTSMTDNPDRADVYLYNGRKLTFGSNFAVGSTFDKLKVCINEANGLDYTFTNGYSARVKYATGTDKAGQVIPPAEFFDAYYDNNNVALSSALRLTDGGEAELFEPLYSYVDATGTLHENVQAVVLDGSETSIGYRRTIPGSSESIEAMYICTTPASENNGQGLVYGDYLDLRDNVPLIIADGCKLTAPGIRNLVSGKTLTIYTQSGQTGQIVANTYSCNVNLAQRFVAYAPGATESDPMTATAIVSGNVTDLSAIAGKTLKPLGGYIVAVADGISLMDGTTAKTPDFTITTGAGTESEVTTPYYIYQASTEQNPVTVTFSYGGTDFVKLEGLPEGTTLNPVEGKPMQRSFAMPAQDVTLSATAVTGLTASSTITYSGSAQTPAILLDESAFETTNYTVTGITPKEGTNSQLTDGSAVNAGEYSIAITGLGQYIGTTSVDFTIGKVNYNGTTTASAYVQSGRFTTDKTLTLPDLPDGASYAATGIVGGNTSDLISGTPSVSGTTLTYSTTSQSDQVSATITIGVTGATNYNDYDVVVTVTARDKEETVITIRESTPITKTYGDADFTLHPSVPAAAGSGDWTWASAHTDVATISENGTVTIQKAGEATIRLFFESQTHFGEASIKLTVNQKILGITWNTDGLVYDGTPKAPTAHLTGVKSGDDCSVDISVEGEHTAVGTGYTATASLSGTAAGNYTLPEDKKSNAFTISPKPVTVSSTGITAENKIYDGTTSATLSGSFAFDDGMIIDGDDVTITDGTGAFADKNVGTSKTVVISGVTLGGTDAGNYTLIAQPTGITGSITKKTVTVTSGITASNKTYDGTTWATLSGSSAVISGKVTGDVLGVSASGAFANKNAGTGKTVTISSITLTGTDKGNYVLTTTSNQATTTANISKKALTVTADDKSVEYGDAAPTYTASYSGFVSGESKSNLSGSLSFSCSYTSSSKTGTYTITPSGYTSGNYSISYAAGTLTVGAKDVDYSGGTITQDENGYTVTLDEGTGSANTLPDDANLYSLTYSRTLTPPGSGEGEVTIGGQAANLYTVCLPFSPETGTGVKYYTLSGVSGETVSFEEVTTPAANTPYLIAVTGSTNIAESCTGMVVTSMEINSTTKDGYTFTGTFTGLKHDQAVGKHILQSHNKWRVVEASGSVFIPPFRAYIESTNGARLLTGCLDDEATGIDSLRLQDADGTEQWYDLNGRRISKPIRKGVYIHNGKVTTKR